MNKQFDLNEFFDYIEQNGYNVDNIRYVYPLYRITIDGNDEYVDVCENNDGSVIMEHYIESHVANEDITYNGDNTMQEAVDWLHDMLA